MGNSFRYQSPELFRIHYPNQRRTPIHDQLYTLLTDTDPKTYSKLDSQLPVPQFGRMPSEFYMPEHPRYRCCCQLCHVRTGSYIISIVCMLLCSYFFIKGVVFVAKHPDDYPTTSIIAVVAAVVCFLISVLLLIGVWKEKRLLLIPYLVVQALVVFVAFAMALVCVVYLFTGEEALLGPTDAVEPHAPQAMASQNDQWWLKAFVVGAAVIYSVAFALGIWFFIVVVQCFRWMKERSAHLKEKEAQMPLNGYPE